MMAVADKLKEIVELVYPNRVVVRPAGYTVVFDEDGRASVTEPEPKAKAKAKE
jgi:hypothetical protein